MKVTTDAGAHQKAKKILIAWQQLVRGIMKKSAANLRYHATILLIIEKS